MTLGWKIIAGLLLLAGLIAGEKIWEHRIYQRGWDARDEKAQVDEAQIRDDAEKKHAADAASALKRERDLRANFDAQMTERDQREKQYEDRIAALQADARASRLKLSIATPRSSLPGCLQGTDSTIASGTGGEARADLMPEAAAAAIGIAADSARDVRDYNRIVDLYNAARETCNAVSPPS